MNHEDEIDHEEHRAVDAAIRDEQEAERREALIARDAETSADDLDTPVRRATEEVCQMLREERESILQQFEALNQTIAAALAAHHRGDAAETKLLCKEMLDREYDLLGDTRSEELAKALGYTEDDDE